MLINELQKKIKYKFMDENLLEEALVHSSKSIENFKNIKKNYERLEFLGDRVLGLILAEYFFYTYPQANEGTLNGYFQNYANKLTLAEYAKKIKLSDFIIYQKGDNLKDNISMLSDVIESIIGAMYLDSNLDNCKRFIINEIMNHSVISDKPIKHPKSILQEYSLNKYKCLPKYAILKRTGNDHNPIFIVSVKVDNFESVKGTGSNLKSAEEAAALKLIDILKI